MKYKRVVVMLLLLVIAGQTLALTTPPCGMAQSLAGPMTGDASVHAKHAQHNHAKPPVTAAVEPHTSDCCEQGHSNCSMSSCVSMAMMSAPQPVVLPLVGSQPPMYSPEPVQSRYPSSPYRPPIPH